MEYGTDDAQVFKSSEEGGASSMHLMYLLAIAAATKSIHLSMSYFVPSGLAQDAMIGARKRGVTIQIIVPGRYIDKVYVRKASRDTWGPLLRAGVEIFEFQPTMFHCKILVIDELFTSVGSTNFDNRSFKLNDEANLIVYTRQFAERQLADFRADLHRAKQITFDEWKKRPWREKAKGYALKIIQSQL